MNRRDLFKLCGAAALSFAIAMPAHASEKDLAIKMVDAAAKAVEANADVGLKAIQDGKFKDGEVYAFAYSLDGTMVAHPANPKLVGQNLIEKPDVEGKYFRKEIIVTAQTKNSGWVDYTYKNPETGKMEQKTTYLKRAGNHVICAGVYK